MAQIESTLDNFRLGTLRVPANPSDVSGVLRAFNIGNSLTEDSGAATQLQVALAADSGFVLSTNYHVWDGHDLSQIVADPNTFSEVFPSTWNIAMPGSTRQLFAFQPAIGATIGQETSAFLTLAASANSGPSNPKARFLVYETWPQTTSYSNYQTYWNQGIVDDDATAFTQQLASVNALYRRVQAALGAMNAWVVPMGSVMAVLDGQCRAGNVAGATQVQDFYRDATHLGQAGRFLATAVFCATYYRRPLFPSDATLASFQQLSNGTSTVTLNQAMASLLSNLAWGVICMDPRAVH